jgi:hypothetical protein
LLQGISNDLSKLPIHVQALMLQDDTMIYELPEADDMVIICEMVISLDPNSKIPWAFNP